MADVLSTLALWSSTTGSNFPTGATAIGAGLDDNIRELQGAVVRGLSHKGVDIASSTTPALGGTEGLFHDITGTSTITGFDTVREGLLKIVKFEDALTLTHNATNLILPGGANITTADKDIAVFISEGSGNWRCVSYFKASGRAIINTANTQPTRQVLTSGTGATYTTPANTTRIVVRMVGGGGGGAAAATNSGANGTNTTFSTFTASAGVGGVTAAGNGGAGGAAAGGTINIPGGSGNGGGATAAATTFMPGGHGGSSVFGGAGAGGNGNNPGLNAATNSGGGGGGAGGVGGGNSGGGGGAGGYVEAVIATPATTYTYTVGASGAGGAAGSINGGNGAAGIIIVDEFYD